MCDMVLYNSVIDDYRPREGYYECVACGTRVVSDDHLPSCPDCGGDVRNIAVPRE